MFLVEKAASPSDNHAVFQFNALSLDDDHAMRLIERDFSITHSYLFSTSIPLPKAVTLWTAAPRTEHYCMEGFRSLLNNSKLWTATKSASHRKQKQSTFLQHPSLTSSVNSRRRMLPQIPDEISAPQIATSCPPTRQQSCFGLLQGVAVFWASTHYFHRNLLSCLAFISKSNYIHYRKNMFSKNSNGQREHTSSNF